MKQNLLFFVFQTDLYQINSSLKKLKKIPLKDDFPSVIHCTNCNLPMQYQKKIFEKFLWQCFKCGKKYFIYEKLGNCTVEETWSPPK